MLNIKNALCIEDTQDFIKWYYITKLNVVNVLDIKYSFVTDMFEVVYLAVNKDKILETQTDKVHRNNIVKLMEKYKEDSPWIF